MLRLAILLALSVSVLPHSADASGRCAWLYLTPRVLPWHPVWESNDIRLLSGLEYAAKRAKRPTPLACETLLATGDASAFPPERGRGVPTVLFHQEFLRRMSFEALIGIAAHEIGHIVRQKYIYVPWFDSPAEEMAVDRLAATWVGKDPVIKGLEETRAYIMDRVPPPYRAKVVGAIDARIYMLQSLQR